MSPATNIIIHIVLFISLYFEVFLLLVFLEKARKQPKERTVAAFPKATVIVPCYNEERTVAGTLRSLLALDYPKEKLEVFAVDDGSRDDTWCALQEFAAHPAIRIIRKQNGGKHTALNLALGEATGDIVGCLDADSTVESNALLEIVRAFEADPECMAMTPAIITAPGKGVLGDVQRAEYSLAIFMRKALSLIDSNIVTPGPFSFFRRQVFEQIGPYRAAHNTEDLEIALRMQSHHLRIGNAPRAHVYTKTPATLGALIRQRVRWTHGFLENFLDYRFMVLRPSHGAIGMLVLPTAFFSIFSALFFFGMMIGSAGDVLAREAVRYDTIGFSFSPSAWGLSWFYLNTCSYMFIIGAILAITIALVLIGRRLSDDPRFFGVDLFWYLLIYGLIAPLWLARAAWRTMLSRDTDWAGERDRLK